MIINQNINGEIQLFFKNANLFSQLYCDTLYISYQNIWKI